MTARSVGRFFKTEGNSLERAYKHHLSSFEQWDQKAHAEDWLLLAENFGEKMSIDETMLCDDLTRQARASMVRLPQLSGVLLQKRS